MSTESDNPLQPAPPWRDVPEVDQYPFEDTHDLRHGPDLHKDLLALLPFVGLWRGRGQGGYPTIEGFHYGQEIRISHDGRPFLHYESRAWLLDSDSKPIRPAGRESGWWRPAKGGDEVEALITTPTGIIELHYGVIETNPPRIEMATDFVARTETAKEVTAGQRLYGIVEGALLYAQDMAAVGHPLTSHLSARLLRVGG
jgi:hypothetical protein